MPLCRPEHTSGGKLFWNQIFQDSNFILLQHFLGGTLFWPFVSFRVVIKVNSFVIATSHNLEQAKADWNQTLDIYNKNPFVGGELTSYSLYLVQLFKDNFEKNILIMGNNIDKESNTSKRGTTNENRNKQTTGTNKHSSHPHTDQGNDKHHHHHKDEPKKQTESVKQPDNKQTRINDNNTNVSASEIPLSTQISNNTNPPSSATTTTTTTTNTAPTTTKPNDTNNNNKAELSPDVTDFAKDQFKKLNLQLKASEKEGDELSETIPLELAPDDVKFGDFIGEGVYSEVFKGFCYGTQVAVKKFKNQGLDAEVLKGVRKEVRIMKSIRHPNLLLFLGACTTPGHLMIVTEIMEKSFHDLNKTKVDIITKLKMAKNAAKGISWLHSLTPAIIHRDLKPENILIAQNGLVVKVADFGLSLVKDHSKTEAEEMKKIRGSPAFMSPEALLGNELTPKTDVYSFGMILWELLTGGSPYDKLEIESFEELIDEICHKGTRESIPKDCPPTLRQLMLSCWKSDPLSRPSFLTIIQKLDECIAEAAISDKDGREMWERSFLTNNELITEVPWTAFLQVISMRLHMSPNMKIFQGLRALFGKEDETKEKVTIEEFGNVLKWFGPMDASSSENFLTRMQNVFTKRWFHGDISVETAQTRLAGNDPGTFLIRFSSNPGSYALSKIIENNRKERAIVHIRIPHEPGSKYSFVLDEKTYEYDSLEELVKAKVLGLTTACPGSYYYAQFRIKQIVSGYINTVNQ